MRRRFGRIAAAAGLCAAAGAAILAAGCGTLSDVVSPAAARGAAADATQRSPSTPDCRVRKCVALTFDGGPSRPTPTLLDILDEENVPATFFVQGKGHTDTYPATLRRMADEGHEIANHTWSHKVLTDLGAEEVADEMKPVQDDVRRITGRTPTLMRPPQGRTSDEVSAVMKELGLAQVLWSVTAKDYATDDTELIRRRVLDGTRRDGIVLLHERYAGTIPAVPGIIGTLRDRGYTFVTVSQLLAPAVPQPGAVYRP
ncbi:polysaccharide deacetylase family protein [Streptomyces wuyuanensis]|uniref:polysaccharide deacetylase family protein n=1 Tax=Streptomyces wuyuanensis TaxID=1196353 RepID=UPI0034484ECC